MLRKQKADCSGLNGVPLKYMSTSKPLNVSLFGKKVFAVAIKLRILRFWVLNTVAHVHTRDGEDAGEKPCDHRGRDWSDAAARGTPAATRLQRQEWNLPWSLGGGAALLTP